MSRKSQFIRATIAAALLGATVPSVALASSHREAPLLLEDPSVDATDLWAFRNGNNVVIVASYIPFESPPGGPNFYRFSDNAVYRINIDNTGDAVADIVFEFRFTTHVANGGTFLYNTGPIPAAAANLNVTQTYTLTRVVNGTGTVVATNVAVAPAFVGRASYLGPTNPPQPPATAPDQANRQTGENAAAQAAYDAYVSANNFGMITGGGQVFAGPRDDGFFIDLGGVFDLLRIRPGAPGNAGGGVDHIAGFNAHALVIEVPITQLTMAGAMPTDVGAQNAILGIWTTAYRPRVHVLRGSTNSEWQGQLVQVSRLGYPLVNEVLIPLSTKDFYLGSLPANDVANFAPFLANNLVTPLLNSLYGLGADVAGVGANLVTLVSGGFIRGGSPMGTLTPADILRLNVAIPGNPFPAPGSRATLGALGGDNAGFPNGRRLADDVVDIELRVLGGALTTPPNATGAQLGDGVNQNDVPFPTTFPYLARPHEGYAQGSGLAMPMVAPR